METRKQLTSAELLAARSWTRFLKSLPIGEMTWRVENYRDFISLRSTASMLTSKKGATRAYSILQNETDNTVYLIRVIDKDNPYGL